MKEGDFPPLLLRIARHFNLYLLLGIIIVISALGLGAWESTVLQALHEAEVAQSTGTAAYVRDRQLEDILRIVTPTWNFVGLALLTFGIGMSIVIIIFNLKGAATDPMEAYRRAFPDAHLLKSPNPWFARAFPVLLFVGLTLEIGNFLFALSGGFAAARAISLESAGLKGSQEWVSALSWAYFVEVLRTPQRPGALSFIVLGIGLSLAAIVYNLRLQARLLPRVMEALKDGKPAKIQASLVPRLPRFPFALLAAGFVIVLSASYPVGFLGAVARASIVAGTGGAEMARQLAWTTALFPVIAVTGIVTMLSVIAYWLILIIQALRDQRRMILSMGSSMAGTEAPPLEQPLWLERVAGYLAGGGVLTLLLLFIPATILIFLRWEVLEIARDGQAFIDLVFLRDFLGVLIPDMRFTGMSLVMLGIGLTLGAIIINLKGMGMILPATMTKILRASGESVASPAAHSDQGDVEGRALSAMAPARSFAAWFRETSREAASTRREARSSASYPPSIRRSRSHETQATASENTSLAVIFLQSLLCLRPMPFPEPLKVPPSLLTMVHPATGQGGWVHNSDSRAGFAIY